MSRSTTRLVSILVSLVSFYALVACGPPEPRKRKQKELSPQVKELIERNQRNWEKAERRTDNSKTAANEAQDTSLAASRKAKKQVKVERKADGGKRFIVEEGTHIDDMPPELQRMLKAPPEVQLKLK